MQNFDYDVIIVGAGPGGIFSAYELTKEDRGLKIAVFEAGHPLAKRLITEAKDKTVTAIEEKIEQKKEEHYVRTGI